MTTPLRVAHYINQFFAGIGGEEQAPVEHGGVVAHAHLARRRLGQGQAEPLEKREFAAQRGLRRSVGGRRAAW